MENDNIHLENLTEKLLHKINLDEPSVDFTGNVMLSIANQPLKVKNSQKSNYWWIYTMVPVLIILTLVFIIPGLSSYLSRIIISVYTLFIEFAKLVITPIISMSHINFSPFMLVCIIAGTLLLLIDGLTKKLIHK